MAPHRQKHRPRRPHNKWPILVSLDVRAGPKGSAHFRHAARKANTAFNPPNAKAFDSATCTRALRATDASATQSIKFVELIWASLAGIAVFGDYPTETTMLGGFVIFLSTTWIARREARQRT